MVITLFILLSILVIVFYREYYLHQSVLEKIPIRIHVNGSRGKSSVTRLIAAGLRHGGFRTMAKTTGSSPRIIDTNGTDREIQRLRSASIGEQVKLLRFFSKQKLDAVVMECMAVQPEYQWISEHKMLKSTIRPDHIEEMGPTMTDITKSLGNTIPENKAIIIAPSDHQNTLQKIANDKNSKLVITDPDEIESSYMEKFSHLEHKENVALSLEVCMQLGIENDLINGTLSLLTLTEAQFSLSIT